MSQDCQACARFIVCPNSISHDFWIKQMSADRPAISRYVEEDESPDVALALMGYLMDASSRPDLFVRALYGVFLYAVTHGVLQRFIAMLSVPREDFEDVIPVEFVQAQVARAAYLYELIHLRAFHAAMEPMTVAGLNTYSVKIQNNVKSGDRMFPCKFVSAKEVSNAVSKAGGPGTPASRAAVRALMAYTPNEHPSNQSIDLLNIPAVGGIN